MDLTEQDTGILPVNSSKCPLWGANDSGKGRGMKGAGRSRWKHWKRLLQPCLQLPAHVRHPGEQHRGAMEPSQRVPELTWLPRWWQSAGHWGQGGAAWKIPGPAAALKSCRVPKGHESPSLGQIRHLSHIPAFSRGYCWTENYLYPLQVVIFHPTPSNVALNYFILYGNNSLHWTSNHPSQLSLLMKQLEMPLFPTPGFHPWIGFKIFSQTKLWPHKPEENVSRPTGSNINTRYGDSSLQILQHHSKFSTLE